ncbi:MAG: alpha/beta hydrolase [Nostocoides sp.]
MILSRTALAAALGVLALTASACTSPGQSSTKTSTLSVAPQAPPSIMAGTERFYSQKLVWKSCGNNECTKLTVPIDYAKPGGDTIQLAVVKVRAKGDSKGALVVNPGGPGGSGVDYALAADFIVGPPVRDAYDIVGFDPRGVGRSAPITCVQPAQLDSFLAFDPTPDNPAEEQAFADNSKSFADACAANAGPLLGHVSTVDAAKDMDVLRAALGETRLNYLGKSYGTFLGSTYAGLFPKNVGRFVLDGVVPPELTNEELNLGQAEGFERATRAWAASCVATGKCVLGSSVDEVMQGLRDLFHTIDQSPLTDTGDSSVPKLTEGWASTGVAYAMYDESLWPKLDDALRAVVENKDGSVLMSMADSYADRDKGGGYSDNIMQVIYAVNCLDRPDTASLADHERQATEADKIAPTWGTFLMWSSMPCAFWPDKPAAAPSKISAVGSGLIVVVGTTRDPATPYEWSVMLNKELANSTLITFDGDGHTAYTRSNACVDDAIDAYYVKGTPPPADLKC